LAVSASLERGLLLLTGGPGTGKTTTVGALVAAQESAGRRVALCAPTGRAAKRLSEATGREAKTIHRLLEWTPATGGFRRGPEDPIPADVVLVDEASMLDLRLAQSLVEAVAPEARLVLVGDRDQLPPVGPGQVLRDALGSGVGETVRLTQVFRQAEQSAIVRGAHAILHGHMPTPTPRGEQSNGDLFVIEATDPDEIQQKLLRLLARMRDAYGLEIRRDVQVLSPMRRGKLGTSALNELLQAELNPKGAEGTRGIRVGDKVMQLRNDYEREVFNGDVGEVVRFEGATTYVRFDGREVRFFGDALGALSLAYASTVHKVQGSEFPAVVIVLHGAHHMLLTRALLYTAVTRGKRLVVLLGDPRAMARAARNAASLQTRSRLLERLRGDRPLARPKRPGA
ncbi:MAG: AAA family ATPase, partial [Deltaproteobacteria bacterium]|nr:AAA family ATPase [Deltaproteobacteria bacterium]